jgi:ribonuclease HI
MNIDKIFEHISPEWNYIINQEEFLETFAKSPDIDISDELLLDEFKYTAPSKLKVVIIGLSCSNDINLLSNIYNSSNGCLKHWAIQGILFLKDYFTTSPWKNYTNNLIERIKKNTNNVLIYSYPLDCIKEIKIKYPNFKFEEINFRIYTDGACKGNNSKVNRIGGYGVYITTYDGGCFNYSIYGRLSEKILPTNNRAEIMAMIKTFQWIKNMDFHPKNVSFDIYTDSELLYNIITKYMHNWDMNVPTFKNPDMIKVLWKFNNYLAKKNYNIKFYHIRGHQKNSTIEAIGNNMADKLANDGCMLTHFNTISF